MSLLVRAVTFDPDRVTFEYVDREADVREHSLCQHALVMLSSSTAANSLALLQEMAEQVLAAALAVHTSSPAPVEQETGFYDNNPHDTVQWEKPTD